MKHSPKERAFTLIELLATLLIIAVLAALLFPVLAQAKESAKKTACASNLHQSSVALSLYLEDQGDYPARIDDPIGTYQGGKLLRTTSALAPYVSKSKSVLVCPFDRPEGRVQAPADRAVARSYAETWLLWEGFEGRAAWQSLLQSDPNPIVFRCHFHTSRVRSTLTDPVNYNLFGNMEHGDGLAVRKDGSVFTDKRNHYFPGTGNAGPEDIKATLWSLATSKECPTTVCDGKAPKEGLREP